MSFRLENLPERGRLPRKLGEGMHGNRKGVHGKFSISITEVKEKVVRGGSWTVKSSPRLQVCNLSCKQGRPQDLLVFRVALESRKDHGTNLL